MIIFVLNLLLRVLEVTFNRDLKRSLNNSYGPRQCAKLPHQLTSLKLNIPFINLVPPEIKPGTSLSSRNSANR